MILQNIAVKFIIICLYLFLDTQTKSFTALLVTPLYTQSISELNQLFFFIILMPEVLQNQSLNFSIYQSSLKGLDVNHLPLCNLLKRDHYNYDEKSVNKDQESMRLNKRSINKIMRQFSNQNYNLLNTNQPQQFSKNTQISAQRKLKKYQSYQNLFEKYENKNHVLSDKKFNNPMIYSIRSIKTDQLLNNSSQSNEKSTEQTEWKTQLKKFHFKQTTKKLKQTQKTIYLIKNHLELINSKVNEFQHELLSNDQIYQDEQNQENIILSPIYQKNVTSKLKKLHKLVRLLKIAEKFAFQAQQQEQTQKKDEIKYFYSQLTKPKYQSQFYKTIKKEQLTKNQLSPLKQLTQNILQNKSLRKQNKKPLQLQQTENNKISNLNRNNLMKDGQNLKLKRSDSFKVKSIKKDSKQKISPKIMNSNQRQVSIKRQLFRNEQKQIFSIPNNSTQKLNHQIQHQSTQKSAQMTIKFMNLSIHVLNLFRHSLSQNSTLKIRTNQKHNSPLFLKHKNNKQISNNTTQKDNQRQKEINQIRDILTKLKSQTQQVYQKHQNQRKAKMRQTQKYVKNQKQKETSIQVKIDSLYNQIKSVFRKLQKYCKNPKLYI